MPRGLFDRTKPEPSIRPLKAVNQKLGRLFNSKEADNTSFIYIDPGQSLPSTPHSLEHPTHTFAYNYDARTTASLPSSRTFDVFTPDDPKPVVRMMGRGGAGSRQRVLKDDKSISRQQTRDSQASSSSTDTKIRYGGRGGAGRTRNIQPPPRISKPTPLELAAAHIARVKECCSPKSARFPHNISPTSPISSPKNARFPPDISPTSPISSPKNARFPPNISPTSTYTELPTPTDPVFPSHARQPIIIVTDADEEIRAERRRAIYSWEQPRLISTDEELNTPKNRADTIRHPAPQSKFSLPFGYSTQSLSSQRRPKSIPALNRSESHLPFEAYFYGTDNESETETETEPTSPQGRRRGWAGEWNGDDIQDVIHRLRLLR